MGGGGARELQGKRGSSRGIRQARKREKSVGLMVLERKWMTSLRGGAQEEEEVRRR